MVEVLRTEGFVRWLAGLRDLRARGKDLARIVGDEALDPGDVKPVGADVSVLRVNYGPGYRVHYLQRAGLPKSTVRSKWQAFARLQGPVFP
jgi:putative addiction module killer protein